MADPTPVTLRPHHDGLSYSTDWYGPDRNELGKLRRHYKRFGKEKSMSLKAARGVFNRWLEEEWRPQYGSGKASEVLQPVVYTVKELCKDYFDYAQRIYVKNGKTTSHVRQTQTAMEALTRKFGTLDVNAMTAPLMVQFRDSLLVPTRKKWNKPMTVASANSYFSITKKCFRWARAECGTVSAVVAADVLAVAQLRVGRCAATPSKLVLPVTWEDIESTCKKLTSNLAVMVKLQWWTGMRPGEVRLMRPCDIDTSGDIWAYVPWTHKTEHKGRKRRISIGAEGQKLLSPYLTNRKTTDYCFRPSDVMHEMKKLRKGDMWGMIQYTEHVRNAAQRASVAHWHPNQIRHSWATRVAELFGIEAASEGLGHSTINMTAVYVERSAKRADDVARKAG